MNRVILSLYFLCILAFTFSLYENSICRDDLNRDYGRIQERLSAAKRANQSMDDIGYMERQFVSIDQQLDTANRGRAWNTVGIAIIGLGMAFAKRSNMGK
ncbi:hypothetical protein JIN85_05990 [Luteolibacter pohnpeiensis]|uniref:Uncharacterized protein n=1 Tax=Luteolibacter pohnpeiensis TaxID=454153 RepID=A0A934S702_9BACT|nr:hypothetical protein [Luteolibacter pohnpeiensis]MBK1881956.1 hypothetical protein [Luteolibacter pohnpeiensis]